VRPPSKPNEKAQLRVIAEWFDRASRWLEEEVRDNRERDLVEGVSSSGQVVETLTFLRPELDRMVTGFRRATDMLVTMTVPVANPEPSTGPTNTAPRSRSYLRLVK
jgi:hypothetical protein